MNENEKEFIELEIERVQDAMGLYEPGNEGYKNCQEDLKRLYDIRRSWYEAEQKAHNEAVRNENQREADRCKNNNQHEADCKAASDRKKDRIARIVTWVIGGLATAFGTMVAMSSEHPLKPAQDALRFGQNLTKKW